MAQPDILPDPDESFRTMLFMYMALMGGSVLTAVIILYITHTVFQAPLVDDASASILAYGALMAALIIPIAGQFLFRHYVDTAGDDLPLADKLATFTTANIARWACMDGAVMASMIAYMLSHSATLLVAAVALLGVFGLMAPTRQRFAESFRLSAEEDDLLRRT